MTNIDVTLRLKDELSDGFAKVNKETEELGKRFQQIGVNVGDMSDEFLELNPQLKAYKELTEKAAKGSGELADSVGEVSDSVESAEKGGKKLNTQLTGLIKGFVGITGAIVAGRALAKFAKDSLAAAGAAGQLPPIFTASEKASNRLKIAAGTQLGNALEGTTKIMTRVKNSTADNLELTQRLIEAERKGIITTQEFNIMRVEQNKGMRSQVDVLGTLTEAEEAYAESIKLTGDASEIALAQIEERERLAAAQAGVAAVIPVEIVPFFKDLDLNIGSQIQTAMAQIDFEEAGGRELVEGFKAALAALDVGDIGQGLADDMFAEMFVQAEQIKVTMGTITADEAARNIRDTLGVSFSEALAMVSDIEGTLRRIDGMKVIINFQGIPHGVGPSSLGLGVERNLASGGQGIVPPGFPNDSFVVGLSSGESFDVRTPAQQNNQPGGMSTAALESEISGLRGDIKNMVLDFQQTVVEAVG